MSSTVSSLRIPYPGLRSFEAADYPFFFGRESQINAILRQLEDHRFVAVIGSSGCGKSSIVRSGLISAVHEGFLFGTTDWVISIIKPGNAPYQRLASDLCQKGEHSANEGTRAENDRKAVFIETLATLQKSDLGLVNALQNLGLKDRNVMVVVDQFEELFAFQRASASKRYEVTSRDDAAGFVNMLLRSSSEPEIRILVVLTMRSDFIGHCEAFLGLPEALCRSQFLVPRLDRKQMEEAIVRPGEVKTAHFQPFTFEQDLVNRIINDSGDRPDQLPMMQHALLRTWKRAVGRNSNGGKLVLSHEDYENAGQIEEALSRDAEEVWEKIRSDTKKAQLTRSLFLLLCDVSPDRQVARRHPQVSEVMAVTSASVGEVEEVVREFQADDRNFLLPPSNESLTPDKYLDIGHEALLRQWGRFSEWFERERTAVVELRRLVEGALLYREKAGALLQPKDLDRITQWRQDNLPSAAWAQRYVTLAEWNEAENFIESSAHAEEQRQETERKREKQSMVLKRTVLLTLIIATGMFVLSMVLVAWFALQQAAQSSRAERGARGAEAVAQREKQAAEEARKEADAAALKAKEEAEKAKKAETQARQEEQAKQQSWEETAHELKAATQVLQDANAHISALLETVKNRVTPGKRIVSEDLNVVTGDLRDIVNVLSEQEAKTETAGRRAAEQAGREVVGPLVPEREIPPGWIFCGRLNGNQQLINPTFNNEKRNSLELPLVNDVLEALVYANVREDINGKVIGVIRPKQRAVVEEVRTVSDAVWVRVEPAAK